jgi:hypothetical protein
MRGHYRSFPHRISWEGASSGEGRFPPATFHPPTTILPPPRGLWHHFVIWRIPALADRGLRYECFDRCSGALFTELGAFLARKFSIVQQRRPLRLRTVCTVGESLAVDCRSSMQVIKLIAEKVYGHCGRVIGSPRTIYGEKRHQVSTFLDDAEA